MGLKKQLNGIEVFSVAAGAMISSGLFVLPAYAYKEAGAGMIFSYLFAGILMLPALFTQLELATAIPKAGGTYFFTERILGSISGLVNGLANWFSITLKSAFALIGIGVFSELIFPGITPLQVKLIAAGACVFFTILNLFSVKSSGKIQVLLVAFLIFILSLFILFGYRAMHFSNFKSIPNTNWWNIFTVTGMVFISYGGLTKIASIAEEVKNPKKNLVIGTIGAFVIVQTLYLLVIMIVIGVLPHQELIDTHTPISLTSKYLTSNNLLSILAVSVTAIGAMLAFITTANAGIMTASRVPLAMSRDSLIPEFIGKISSKKKIPFVSILFTSGFMLAVILLLEIKELAKVASLFMLMLFVMVNLSLLVVRFSKIANYKPSFKSPGFPVVQIIGIAVYIFLIFKMCWGNLTITLIAVVFIILCIVWYFIYARKRVERKSAFIHMVENLSAPELTEEVKEEELESELLEILIERDDIVQDRFDEIIKKCIVIDLHKTISRDELFKEVAKVVAKRWDLDEKDVEEKFKIREGQASTLIYPGVAIPHAIPHAIVPGENLFDIVLVRNKFGITWNEEGEVVYTAFSLIGSKDERNFHLRALMFIAQILQDPDFHNEWMKARNEKELRSVILLTKRRRK